jgi:hypothetical protein
LKLIYYKERETPWSITTITTNSKRTNEKKSYIYESVVIPDAQNIKRKIVKNKLEKILTLTTRKKIISDESKATKADTGCADEACLRCKQNSHGIVIDNDINKQLAAFREQKEKEENELIENYFKTHSTDGGQLIKLNGNSWFIK